MKTLIENYNALRTDLVSCWDTKFDRIDLGLLEDTPMNRMLEAANYVDCIDMENKCMLDLLFKKTKLGMTTRMSLCKDVRSLDFNQFSKKHF